jgi:hypothetical protein
MPPRRHHRTRPTHILPAIAARKRRALHGAAHVNVHVDVHAVAHALQRRVAVVAPRAHLLRQDLEGEDGCLDGRRGELFPERVQG